MQVGIFNTKVEHSNFDNAVINKIATHNAYFRGSNFNNAEITGGEFEDKSKKSLLKRAFFTNSSMKNLTCKGVDMFMTDLNSVDLSGAKFNDNNLYDVNFSGSSMPEIINNTNFTKCNLANTGETYKEIDISNNIDNLEVKDETLVEEISKKFFDNDDLSFVKDFKKAKQETENIIEHNKMKSGEVNADINNYLNYLKKEEKNITEDLKDLEKYEKDHGDISNEEKNNYLKARETLRNDIQNSSFYIGYGRLKSSESSILKNSDDLYFMKEVINQHGTDTNKLQSAVEAITDLKHESPIFMSKLLNDALKSEAYKQAYEKNQNKDKEVAR